MSLDVLRFPVVVPPREGTLTKRLGAGLRRAYEAFIAARTRQAEVEVARHREFHNDAAVQDAEFSTTRLGTLPFVR